MASLNNEIIIKTETRPCYVNGKKALFHKWVDKQDFISRSNYVTGLVEFEDGTVLCVNAVEIQFCDNKINEYVFR